MSKAKGQKLKVSNQRGFSLMELLVYIAVLAVVATVVAQIFITLNQGRGRVEARVEVNNNLRFALEKIKRDLTASSSVSVPAAAGDASSTLAVNVAGTDVSYCVSGGRLRRQVGGVCGGSSEALTSDKVIVDAPVFSRVENSNQVLAKKSVSIGIELRMSYNSLSPEWQFNQSDKTFIVLRQDF